MAQIIFPQLELQTKYFVNELHISGLGEAATRESLCLLIAKLQKTELAKMLGYELSKTVLAALLEQNVPQRWRDLADGADWRDKDGVLHPGGSLLRAFACVVYDRYMRMTVTQTTRSGEKSGRSENTTNTTARHKAVRASRECWEELCKMWRCLAYAYSNGAYVYPEFRSANVVPWDYQPQNIFDL